MENDVWPDKLSDVYASYISMGKIIVLFQHRFVSKQYIKETQMVWNYNIYDMSF